MRYSDEITLNGKRFIQYIDKYDIKAAVKAMAEKLENEFHDKHPIALCIMKGAIIFSADLLRNLNFPCQVETVKAKSYGSGMRSSGNVELFHLPDNLEGRHVLIIEDIVDTGYTLKAIKEKLQEHKPLSVSTACLLSKPAMRKVEVEVEYVGIEIPPVFIIGYGLDFAEQGRNLPHIYGLDSDVHDQRETPPAFTL